MPSDSSGAPQDAADNPGRDRGRSLLGRNRFGEQCPVTGHVLEARDQTVWVLATPRALPTPTSEEYPPSRCRAVGILRRQRFELSVPQCHPSSGMFSDPTLYPHGYSDLTSYVRNWPQTRYRGRRTHLVTLAPNGRVRFRFPSATYKAAAGGDAITPRASKACDTGACT